MNNEAYQLQQHVADASATAFLRSYQSISPRISFAAGNESVAQRLIGYEDRHADFQTTNELNAVVAAGWSALELAAMMPANERARTTMIGRAHERFERAATEGITGDLPWNRLYGYMGRLGTIAAYTYED